MKHILATYVCKGDVLDDGRIVHHRWGTMTPSGFYDTMLSFTDGSHEWFSHDAYVTVSSHINQWVKESV